MSLFYEEEKLLYIRFRFCTLVGESLGLFSARAVQDCIRTRLPQVFRGCRVCKPLLTAAHTRMKGMNETRQGEKKKIMFELLRRRKK